MVEEILMHRDTSDSQIFEDLLTADASLRTLVRKVTMETDSGMPIEPKEIEASITRCRVLLSPAIGKLRDAVYSPPQHAKANIA